MYVPQVESVLVKLTPSTYSATPRSTAHHGLVSKLVCTQDIWEWSAVWSPSLAWDGECEPYSSVYGLLWYAGRFRATLTSRRASTDTAHHNKSCTTILRLNYRFGFRYQGLKYMKMIAGDHISRGLRVTLQHIQCSIGATGAILGVDIKCKTKWRPPPLPPPYHRHHSAYTQLRCTVRSAASAISSLEPFNLNAAQDFADQPVLSRSMWAERSGAGWFAARLCVNAYLGLCDLRSPLRSRSATSRSPLIWLLLFGPLRSLFRSAHAPLTARMLCTEHG